MSRSTEGMRIKCAAIKHEGIVYEGESHSNIGIAMIVDHVCKAVDVRVAQEGFMTECGRFVRREPALIIAIDAGQVEQGQTMHPEKLFSGDLK